MNIKVGGSWNQIRVDIFSKIRHALLKSSYVSKAIARHGLSYAIRYYIGQKSSHLLHWVLSSNWFDLSSDFPKSKEKFYNYWLLSNYLRKADLATLRESIEAFKYKPAISFILLISDACKPHVEDTIESISNQIYPFWEIILITDVSLPSSGEEFASQIQKKSGVRIKTILSFDKGQVSDGLGRAVENASGEFISILEPNGVLTPDALYRIVLEINQRPDVVFCYSDEDEIDEEGYLGRPFFKSDWCPDSFLSRFYTGQLGFHRTTSVREIGRLKKNCSLKVVLYDLVLRLTEMEGTVTHLPFVLYHLHSSLRSEGFSQLEQQSVKSSIEEAIVRRKEAGRVEMNSGGFFSVRYSIASFEKVTVVIPTRNLGDILERCLISIFEKTHYPNFEIVVVDNGSIDPKTFEIINFWTKEQPKQFCSLRLDIPFNFSRINNEAVKQTDSKYLLFLNNDTEIISPGWLTSLVEQVQRPSIGAAGAMLLYPDSTIQHAGVLVGIGGVAGHCFQHYPADHRGYFGQAQATSNYSAVTAACLMCRREVFEEVGGFDESLAAAYNDIDLCLKMIEIGYRNVYLPHVKLLHYESKSRGYDLSLQKAKDFSKEVKYMQARWSGYIARDPCYNPNLPKKFGEHRKVYI